MRKLCCFLLLALGLLAPVHAAEDPALEAMEVLRRGLAGTDDLAADLVQEKRLALMKRKLVSRGVVRFRKPDTFFMELFPPHGSRLLLRDQLMVMRLREQRVTDRIVLPPEEGLRKWIAYLSRPVKSLPEGVEVKAERHGKLWSVQLFPRGKGAVRKLTLTFDTAGNISRIAIDERNGDRTLLRFSNVRRNIGLRDADFSVD